MAAPVFGVTQLAGFVVPAGCEVREITVKESIETVKRRSRVGVTVRNIPCKVKTTEQTIEMDGVASMALLVPGAFVEGTYKVMRVRNRENNNGTPECTVVRKKYETFAAEEAP